MNVTNLYVSMCRLVLQAKADDPSSWQDLHLMFSSVRLSLSCSVCGKLLIEPYTPVDSDCQQQVCRKCKGGRKKPRPSCSCCKDYDKYMENVQLRTLLQCYKKLCQYITNTQLHRRLCSTPSGSNSSNVSGILVDLINEGSGLDDDFQLDSNAIPSSLVSHSLKSTSTQTAKTDASGKTIPVENGDSSYSVVSTNNGNRLTIKRRGKEINDPSQRNGEADKGVKVNKVRKRSVFTPPPTCKCGQSGVLKGCCSGYKCPCYTADSPCSPECMCVACKNPRGTAPPKDPINEQGEILSETAATPVESGSWRDFRRTRTQTPGKSALS